MRNSSHKCEIEQEGSFDILRRKAGVMRLALRLLQAVDAKIQAGQKLMFEDEKTKEKGELLML